VNRTINKTKNHIMAARRSVSLDDTSSKAKTKNAKTKNAKGKTKDDEPPKSEIEMIDSSILKERGEGRFHLANTLPHTRYIPTGVFLIDFALVGGWAEGRAGLIYGVESSSKSTLWMLTCAQFHKKYKTKQAVLADVEHMFDRQWAGMLDVDLNRLRLLQPDHGQEAADMVIAYMSAIEVGLVGIDTLASLVPKQLNDRSVEDFGVGERAKIIGDFCAKALNTWSVERRRDHDVTVLNVNQFRDKMNASKFEDPKKLPGGWQANYFPKIKIQMKQRKIVPQGGKIPIHNLCTFRIDKEKGGTLQSGEFMINLNPNHEMGLPIGAVDDYLTVATYAKKEGLITGGGASWYVNGIDTKFRKRDEIIEMLVNDDDEYARLKQKILIRKRIELKMPPLPPDNYLFGKCLQKTVEEAREAVSSSSDEG
jgi:RecA/RadA recombinase